MSRDNPLTAFWVETWFLLCNVTEEQIQEIKRKVNKMVVNNVEGLVFAIEVCPQKFGKFKYIFVSNLTTFKLKSTFKNCISCLK